MRPGCVGEKGRSWDVRGYILRPLSLLVGYLIIGNRVVFTAPFLAGVTRIPTWVKDRDLSITTSSSSF